MEDIQKLQQDNAKLQERLNNAAKFFREQKAQIEELTKENKSLKNLNDKCNEYELKLESAEKQLEEQRNNYENQITLLKENNIELSKDLEKFNELAHDAESFNALQEDLNKKIETLTSQLNQSNEEIKKETEIRRNSQEKCHELEKRLKEVENICIIKDEEIKKLTELDIDYVNQIDSLKKKFEEEGHNAAANKALLDEANKTIQELQEKLEKINKLYDDCENEKRAFQADYESLNEKYEDIHKEYETLKSKELVDKELLKFNKDDINNLCDTILDFFKDKNLNK